MTTEPTTGRAPYLLSTSRASRLRVPRTRGAVGGVLVLILGAWAALVPFIGPAFDVAYTPNPGNTWHWTAARGWLEVLPGGVAFVGGLLLLLSGHRLITSLGGWLSVLAGAWLIVGPSLATVLSLDIGQPDPARNTNTQAATALLFFYGVGGALLLVAALALGRLSVLTVRDVLAAEQSVAAADAEAETRMTPVVPADEGEGRHGAPSVPSREPVPAREPEAGYPAESSASYPVVPPVPAHEEEPAAQAERGHRWRHLIHH